jgi:hypothetical protein
VAETTPMVVWGWFRPPLGAQEKKQREKQEIKKQTARFFSYIHQYHHYKNPKPKTLMVRQGEAPPFPLRSMYQSFIGTPSPCTTFAAEFQ